MGVAQGRVRDEQLLLLERPFGEFLRAKFEQQLARAWRRRLFMVAARHPPGGENVLWLEAFHQRMAVYRDVAQIPQQLGRAVAARLELEQLRRRVNQRRRGQPLLERVVVDDVFQERNVRLHAANAEFPQRPVHALQRAMKRLRRHRELHQQRIVERRHHRAAVAHAAVQPHAETARRAIRQDAAVIGLEFVFRVFRRDAALHGIAVARHVFLLRNAHFRTVHRLAVGNQDLRPHQVETGDHFRDRVLHLDARIHLDEEPLLGVEVVEKFHRARVVVFDFVAQAHRRLAQLRADAHRQVHARRNFDDLLMPALHRAIALVQMHHAAVFVARESAPRCAWRAECSAPETPPDCRTRAQPRPAPRPAAPPNRPAWSPRASRARRRRTPP